MSEGELVRELVRLEGVCESTTPLVVPRAVAGGARLNPLLLQGLADQGTVIQELRDRAFEVSVRAAAKPPSGGGLR
jgi:hypothetical protein